MSLRALIIAIEEYPRLNERIAGELRGTLDTARAFRDWLLQVKHVPLGNIFFCAHPSTAGSTHGAIRQEIRNAIRKLIVEGEGDTKELYFFFSGHGYAQQGVGNEATGNALLAADYQDSEWTGELGVSHEEIIYLLRRRLGPGDHFHFVDICRSARNEKEFPVGNLAIRATLRDTGEATVHVLYSTSLGDAARVNSAFGDALVTGLHGRARAKEWSHAGGPKLTVRFQSLARYVRSQVRRQKPDPNPGRDPGIIYEFSPPFAAKRCVITVAGARSTDRFELRLADASHAFSVSEYFTGSRHELTRLPNDYHVAVIKPGRRVEPEGWIPVDLYEDTALEFRLVAITRGAKGKGAKGGQPEEMGLTPAWPATLAVLLPAKSDATLREISSGEKIAFMPTQPMEVREGRYEIQVTDRDGWPIRRRTVEVRPGQARTIDLQPTASPLHQEILQALPEGGSFGVPEFSESLGPLADEDPALWLAVVGASRIVRRPDDPLDYWKMRHLPLADFAAVAPGGSALYLLVGLEEDAGILHAALSTKDRPRPQKWQHVRNADGFQHLCQYAEPREPGPALLSLSLGSISVITVATAFLPNRATLVTVTQDREGALQVYQMMLPLGHLLRGLPYADRFFLAHERGFSRLRGVKYIVQAQRAFRQREAMVSSNQPQPRTRDLEELLYGKWLDPVMGALAAYELLRRGRRDHLQEVARNLQTYFPDLPDTAALVRLINRSPGDSGAADHAVPSALPQGCPLFLDGLTAYEGDEGLLPLPAARLDLRSMWTMWRGAVSNPSR